MNRDESELMEGLRTLAAMEPREASPRVENALIAEFRARAGRRRRRLWTVTAAVAAGIALLAVAPFAWHSVTTKSVFRAGLPRVSAPVAHAPALAASMPQTRYAVVRSDDAAAPFYPLPEADELPPLENSVVVRVQMPASSLQMMGYPIEGDANPDPVQADVLLGQDGLARGVRLIQ
jgi:hypothetical protein